MKSPTSTEMANHDECEFPTQIVSMQEVAQMSQLEKSNYLLALHSELLTISSMD